MKTIIVYYSNTHNNEILAYYIQKKLSCDILKIEEVRKRTGLTILMDLIFNRTPKLNQHSISLELYSDIIFVAPIWASKIASPLRAFLHKEKQNVKHYSFISLCGGVKGQLENIKKQLSEILGCEPSAAKELWISDILAMDKKNNIKYTSGYRVVPTDLENFRQKIDEFLNGQLLQSNSKKYELQ